MKRLNKILLSFLCCISMLFNFSMPMMQVMAKGDGTTYISKDSITEYTIKTISNVAGDTDITLYEYENHYYITMDTVKELTGLDTSVSTSEGIFSATITDGMRTVWVDLTDRTITDTINGKQIKNSDGKDNKDDINAMLFNNEFLVEAVPFLQYLGASTKYMDGYFICNMNTNSIWSVLPEAVKDLDKYTFEFVSNIPDYEKRLTMDIISDVISGWNFFKSPNDSLNDYYKDALSDALKVNPYKYDTVINKAKENEKASIFDTKYMLDLADQIKDVGSDSYKAIEDLVLTQKIDSLNLKWNDAYKFGFTDDAQKISKELNEKTVKLYNDTVDGGKIDKIGNGLSLLIFTAKIADSFYETYNYDNDAALCLAKEVENIKYTYSDTSSFYWLSEASKISEDVLNKWKNARDSIIDNTVDLMRGEGTDLIISAASSEILLPAKAATLITNMLCHDIQKAWHHEAVVMFQEEMNSHCLNVCKKLYQKAMDECFTNEDTITRLVDVLNFYFRFSIAYNDGVKEWGEHYYPQESWDSATQKLNEVLALRYYNLLNATYINCTNYSELTDDVFSADNVHTPNESQIFDFSQLPSEFVFASGVGAWGTVIEIEDDGTFTGNYHDSEMGDVGDGYPNGSVYICDFNGKFSAPTKITDYIYLMKMEYLKIKENPGTEYIENQIRYICSEPYGFDGAEEFLIYLPGCPINEIDEEFISWAYGLYGSNRKTLPSGFYGIYNIEGKEGFTALADNSIWDKTYVHYFDHYSVKLNPSYYSLSRLWFKDEDTQYVYEGIEHILEFEWLDDEQTEFTAVDSKTDQIYNVSLNFSEDKSKVSVSIKSVNSTDMSKWGGTTAGTLTTDFDIMPYD